MRCVGKPARWPWSFERARFLMGNEQREIVICAEGGYISGENSSNAAMMWE